MSIKIRRIFSMVLVLLILVTMAGPIPARAADPIGPTAKDIEQQIIQIYQRCRSHYGWGSFHGYCGALVNAELYYMGITTSVGGFNGNEVFDAYCNKTMTSGGYRVRAYPVGAYTLEQALKTVTENGTKDVYNLVAGFQSTPSSAGSRYGHAVVIHAIIDGMVYFMESYDVRLNGRRYPEGTPISCTIDQFVTYYAVTTTRFDGVLYFGHKSYADQCRTYPSNLTVKASAGATMRSEPCEARVDERSTLVRTLTSGEKLRVTGLYLNTAGEYWYQIGGEGYVRSSQAQLVEMLYDDVSVSGQTAPTAHREGQPFSLKGRVNARYNSIYTIRAQVIAQGDETKTPVISATDKVEGKFYDLSGSKLSKDMAFRSLTVGQYRYELSAIMGNYYVDAGKLQVAWNTMTLWSADFQVVKRTTGYDIVDLDPNGGTVSVDQTAVTTGKPVGELPVAERAGYVFLGWYTQAEGGQRLDESSLISGDTTLYAHWITHEELTQKWQEQGTCLYYYSDGMSTVGCVELEGIVFYFSTVGSVGQSWTMWSVAGAASDHQTPGEGE